MTIVKNDNYVVVYTPFKDGIRYVFVYLNEYDLVNYNVLNIYRETINNRGDTIIRTDTVYNVELHYKNDELVLIKDVLAKGNKNSFIPIVKTDSSDKFSYLTLDFETKSNPLLHVDEFGQNKVQGRVTNHQFHTVVSCCIWDGSNGKSFYITDYKNEEMLLNDMFKYLFTNMKVQQFTFTIYLVLIVTF